MKKNSFITIRIGVEDVEMLKRIAEQENRSLSAQACRYIQKGMESDKILYAVPGKQG